jgi:hypothetical protein
LLIYLTLFLFCKVSSLCDISSFTCDHCDLQELDRLAKAFFDKLIAASLNRHPRNINERKICALKTELLDCLQITNVQLNNNNNNQRTASTDSSNSINIQMISYSYSLVKTIEILDAFVSRCSSTFARASSILKSGDIYDHFQTRTLEIIPWFPEDERYEIAKLLIRKLDIEYQYHCSMKRCGETCQFAIEHCPNIPCEIRYSRKWVKEHDDICPEKVILCPRTCDEPYVKRKLMENHLEIQCSLRPIDCPYHAIGCHPTGNYDIYIYT